MWWTKLRCYRWRPCRLHGNEEQLYIDTLREALPARAIWKALSVGETLPAREFQHVDKYVLDNGQGRTRQRFDWSLLNGRSLGNVLLAGGSAQITAWKRHKPAAPDLILILL